MKDYEIITFPIDYDSRRFQILSHMEIELLKFGWQQHDDWYFVWYHKDLPIYPNALILEDAFDVHQQMQNSRGPCPILENVKLN